MSAHNYAPFATKLRLAVDQVEIDKPQLKNVDFQNLINLNDSIFEQHKQQIM